MTDPITLLDELLMLSDRLGIEVRRERLGGGGGGLCGLRGRQVLFVDVESDAATQLDTCVAALAPLPEIESIYLTPSLRERIERHRSPSAP